MNGGEEKRTPGAGQQTGGTRENENDHPNIIPEIIPADAAGTDQKDLLPDTDAAVAFLRAFCGDGARVLTSIVPEGTTTTATFTASEDDKMAAWIHERQGKENIYFTVNALYGPVTSKPNKGAVAAIRALHVDVDPRAGEDPVSERARAWSLLRALEPTAIIDSGGGLQAFWLLQEDVAVGGSAELAKLFWRDMKPEARGPLSDAERAAVDAHKSRLAETVEGRNLTFEAALQADNCHNADRIMRLVGTVNLPNERKRKKGRTPRAAHLLWADWPRLYALDEFKSTSKAATGSAERVVLSTKLPKLESLDDLPASVSARTKMLIVNGDDPDDPNKYPSRSEVLFAVLCELVRAGVPDDVIASVILDEEYTISGHVNDQPRPREYAQRQIQRAHEEAVDPWLLRLNDRHTVLGNQGGKCRILEFTRRPTGIRGQTRAVVSLQSFEDFRNRYMNKSVVVGQDKEGKDVKMPVGKWWLQNEHRREFHSLVFSPRDGEVVEAETGDPDERQLNLWRGFAVKPAPGDWSLMRAHIRDILAGGDEASDSYIIRWMAWTVQNPDQPAEVALAFRGEMGTGKGIFGRMMARLFGQHGLHTGGTELISGRFNQHLADCCLLFADEILWDGDKKAEARMKVYLTEETIVIEGKGVDAAAWPNMLHVIMSSNSEWVVPAGRHERRYAVFDVSSAQRQNKEYFKPLFSQMDAGGLAAMLHDMLAMDLGDWHPRQDRPETAALADQKSRGLGPVEAELLDWLREGAVPDDLVTGDRRGTEERPFVYTTDGTKHVREVTRERVTMNMVTDALKQIGAEKSRKDRPSGYLMPTLGDARRAWNMHPDLPNQEWDGKEHWPGNPF